MVFKTDKISVKEMILISLDQKTDTVTKIARKVNTGVSNCSKVVSLMKSEGLIKAEYFGNDGKSKILILTKKD